MADTGIFTWLDRAESCGDRDVERAALVMKDYYQGVGPEPEYDEQATTARNAAIRFDSDMGERAAFEKAMNDSRFFPAELDFSRTKSPSGRDEYVNSHLQSNWEGWQARAALASRPAEVDDEGQSDAKRLMFAMQDVDGFGSVKQDKYDLAVVAMEERALDEPDWECELEGVRRLIDKAMSAPSHTTNKEK